VPTQVAHTELIVAFLAWAAEHDKGFGTEAPVASINEWQARNYAKEFFMSTEGKEWLT
jgi:hypothetical protein